MSYAEIADKTDEKDVEDEADEKKKELEEFVGSTDNVDADAAQELAKYKEYAEMLASGLKFVPEKKNATELGKELGEWITYMNQSMEDDAAKKKLIVVWYNTVMSGESITNPKTRKPPLRLHYQMFMAGVMKAFGGKELPENIVFVIFNGGKEGSWDDTCTYPTDPRLTPPQNELSGFTVYSLPAEVHVETSGQRESMLDFVLSWGRRG